MTNTFMNPALDLKEEKIYRSRECLMSRLNDLQAYLQNQLDVNE